MTNEILFYNLMIIRCEGWQWPTQSRFTGKSERHVSSLGCSAAEARLKRSALAHAPLQIKQKQAARFHARCVRQLMRGGRMEEKEGGRGGAEGWRQQQAGGRGDSALSAPRLNTEQETHSQRFDCLIQLAFYSLIQLEAARNLLQQKLGPRHRDAPHTIHHP